jgi:hypothetical protein
METLPPEDFFMADDFFTSSLGSIYGSGLTSGPNYGIAPFGSESEDVFGLQSPTNLKTDALLALFDSSLASFLDTYPPIDDIYVSDLSDEAGCATNLHMNDGLPDFHFLETSYLGTLPNCPEREDSRHISPVSQVLNFERSNSPDSAYFHGHFMPRMNKAELDYATEELPESAVFDGHALERLPSQDSDCSGTISTSSENDPRVSFVRDPCRILVLNGYPAER